MDKRGGTGLGVKDGERQKSVKSAVNLQDEAGQH